MDFKDTSAFTGNIFQVQNKFHKTYFPYQTVVLQISVEEIT